MATNPDKSSLYAVMGELEGASEALIRTVETDGQQRGLQFFHMNSNRWIDAQHDLSNLVDTPGDLDAFTISRIEMVNEELQALLNGAGASAVDVIDRVKRIRRTTASEVVVGSIEAQLEDVPWGSFIDIKETYGELIPDDSDRVRLLRRIENQSAKMPAVVDVTRERVYKKSKEGAIVAMTTVAPFVFWGLGLLALFGISKIEGLPKDWNLSGAPFRQTLFPAYLFLSLGVVAHLLIENIKQESIQIAPVLPLNHTIDWLHLRWAGIMQTICFAVIAVVGLLIAGLTISLTSDAASEKQILLWMAAGYSLDSVIGVLLNRFGVAAGKQVERISSGLVVGNDA